MVAKLDDELVSFAARRLDEIAILYLIVDARYEKVFTTALWQRCVLRLLRNAVSYETT